MTTPNMLTSSNVFGKLALSTVNTTATTLITNATNSGNLLKINTLTFTNIGNAAASATVTLAKSTVAEMKMANTISVPTNSMLVAISKDTAIYMEEGDTMNVYASSNTYLTVACSYEVIS